MHKESQDMSVLVSVKNYGLEETTLLQIKNKNKKLKKKNKKILKEEKAPPISYQQLEKKF